LVSVSSWEVALDPLAQIGNPSEAVFFSRAQPSPGGLFDEMGFFGGTPGPFTTQRTTTRFAVHRGTGVSNRSLQICTQSIHGAKPTYVSALAAFFCLESNLCAERSFSHLWVPPGQPATATDFDVLFGGKQQSSGIFK